MKLWLLIFATSSILLGCSGKSNVAGNDGINPDAAKAEEFIDAFYSFDRSRLNALLDHAESSKPNILYYQGWAEGGNYKIVNRLPCTHDGTGKVKCPITVKDDFMGALGIPFDVTDTFHLSFTDGKISSVETSSNDLEVFGDAEKWVRRTRPELVSEPCKGYFNGGPTPVQCAQAMVQGYAAFAASDEFPTDPK